MEKSKNTILENIRKNKPAPSPLPTIPDFELQEKNLEKLFGQMLEKVGGKLVTGVQEELLPAALKSRFGEAKEVWASEESWVESNATIGKDTDPHELEQMDLVVIRGQFGVAENAAVWVNDFDLPQRVIAFITLHLVIILKKENMVGNMQQAYQRLGNELSGFGVFISGPSKTADIEQSLVVGAQGPKSLTVYLV